VAWLSSRFAQVLSAKGEKIVHVLATAEDVIKIRTDWLVMSLDEVNVFQTVEFSNGVVRYSKSASTFKSQSFVLYSGERCPPNRRCKPPWSRL
jgi:hypothetical protein